MKQMKKQNKGITLVALVVTIIILLILAGITINSLTENGLFGKAKEAKEKASEAEVKEKVELLLAEYQLDKADNNNLTLLEYFEQKVNEKEIDSVVDNENETIDIKLKGYTVKIDVEHQKIISIEISNDIEFSYKLTSYENNKFTISITISDKNNGIDAIYLPDGITRNGNGKTDVRIDYDIDEGVDYIFTVRNTKGIERKETINFTKPIEPKIQSINMGYLTLTSTGVEIPENVEIEFDERPEFENYYSIDDGRTWKIYDGPVSAISVRAKSVHKKCTEICTMSERKVEKPLDALGVKSCDGNLETYEEGAKLSGQPAPLIRLDKTTYGRNIKIDYALFKNGYHRCLILTFYDEEKVQLSRLYAPEPLDNVMTQYEAEIPVGSAYLAFDAMTDIYASPRIYEVTIK